MRIALINEFYPPDTPITGKEAQVLVAKLQSRFRGARLRVYTVGASDTETISDGADAAQPVEVHRLKSLYRGGRKLPRLAASAYDGFRLARRAVRWADLVISMTSPPLLCLWVASCVQRYDTRWIEWTMDLYPEGFVSAGLISQRNWIFRRIQKYLASHAPDFYICLGDSQHARIQELRNNDVEAAIVPCGVCSMQTVGRPAWLQDTTRIALSYAGNLGEAHSCEVLIDIIRSADPERFVFALAVSGSKRKRLLDAIADDPHVILRDRLDRRELSAMDVHIVSLAASWNHVSVPSKAVSAVCLGRPILFAGSTQSDTWRMLGHAAWLIPEQPDGSYAVRDIRHCLETIADDPERTAKTVGAQRTSAQLNDMREIGHTRVLDEIHRLGAVSAYNRTGIRATVKSGVWDQS